MNDVNVSQTLSWVTREKYILEDLSVFDSKKTFGETVSGLETGLATQ